MLRANKIRRIEKVEPSQAFIEKPSDDLSDKYTCRAPIVTTAGRACYCTFMDFTKFVYVRGRKEVVVTPHRHYNEMWNEFEGGRQIGL
jgi:hypothetical protein